MKQKVISIIIALVAVAMTFSMIGCNLKDATDNKTTTLAEEIDSKDMSYMSPDGYTIRYNAEVVESAEIDEHAAQFVYVGKSAGTNMLEVRYIANKAPEKVLDEVTKEWSEDGSNIKKSEDTFPGTEDQKGYWRELPAKDGKGLGMTAIAGDFKEGTLLFVITSTTCGQDEVDMPVSDAIAEMINGIHYFEAK